MNPFLDNQTIRAAELAAQIKAAESIDLAAALEQIEQEAREKAAFLLGTDQEKLDALEREREALLAPYRAELAHIETEQDEHATALRAGVQEALAGAKALREELAALLAQMKQGQAPGLAALPGLVLVTRRALEVADQARAVETVCSRFDRKKWGGFLIPSKDAIEMIASMVALKRGEMDAVSAELAEDYPGFVATEKVSVRIDAVPVLPDVEVTGGEEAKTA